MKQNIALIGMAGVGKSYTSKTLATELAFSYISVDDLIIEEAKKTETHQLKVTDEIFMAFETTTIRALEYKTNAVIDTGGSVIYSEEAMEILEQIAFIVYLSDSPEHIKERFIARGIPHLVGMKKNMTFQKLVV